MKKPGGWTSACILLLFAASCTHRPQKVDLSLLAIYAGDTVLYNKLTYVIRVKNNGTDPLDLYFDKQKKLSDPPRPDTGGRARLVLAGKDHQQRCALQLFAIYPQVIHLKGEDSLVLAFISDCPGWLNTGQKPDRLLVEEEIRTLLTSDTIYYYGPGSADTIAVTPGHAIPIRFGEIYVDELKKFK